MVRRVRKTRSIYSSISESALIGPRLHQRTPLGSRSQFVRHGDDGDDGKPSGLFREQADHRRTHRATVESEFAKDASRHALRLSDQAKKHMLGADIVVFQLPRFARSQVKRSLCACS